MKDATRGFRLAIFLWKLICDFDWLIKKKILTYYWLFTNAYNPHINALYCMTINSLIPPHTYLTTLLTINKK